MDGNKDESNRCINIALNAAKAGDFQKALKFLRKADNLYPSQKAKELLAELEAKRCERNNSTDGIRHRQATDGQTKNEPNQPTTTSVDYTNDQVELCERIKRCKDYYEILCITKEATDTEIKRSYKKLALQLHPDKNRAPGAVEAFKMLGNAAGVLTDPEKRKHYDLYGKDNNKKGNARQYHTNHEYEHAYRHGFDSDFTADELFNMFFGNGIPQARTNNNNNRQYTSRRSSTQQQYYHNHQQQQQQPSLAFGLILVLLLISMLASFFTSEPVYSLSPTPKYTIQRRTVHLNIPYYVRQQFHREYQGSMARLENNVEEEYIMLMKQNCYRERSYRDLMIARARNFGGDSQMEQAKALKVTSCENLARLGLTKFMPN